MSTPLGTPTGLLYVFLAIGFGVLGLSFLARLRQPLAEAPPAGPDSRQQL
jgi:TRAP-type C4-dicarboxylate transport system permease small subunit